MEQMLFAAEISLYEDPEDGLRFECSENHVQPIVSALSNAGFKCDQPQVAIKGTRKIPNFVAVAVRGGGFAGMKTAVLSCLQAAGVDVSEEEFSLPGEKHIRLSLNNVSLFR